MFLILLTDLSYVVYTTSDLSVHLSEHSSLLFERVLILLLMHSQFSQNLKGFLNACQPLPQ